MSHRQQNQDYHMLQATHMMKVKSLNREINLKQRNLLYDTVLLKYITFPNAP